MAGGRRLLGGCLKPSEILFVPLRRAKRFLPFRAAVAATDADDAWAEDADLSSHPNALLSRYLKTPLGPSLSSQLIHSSSHSKTGPAL